MIKFIEYLTEEVSKTDRKKLIKQILTNNRKDTTIKLSSFQNKPLHIVYSEMKNVVILEYDDSLDELTLALIDICDSMGFDFTEKKGNRTIIFTIAT
jgi:hypothetical protein